jgi:hypothetical protein
VAQLRSRLPLLLDDRAQCVQEVAAASEFKSILHRVATDAVKGTT